MTDQMTDDGHGARPDPTARPPVPTLAIPISATPLPVRLVEALIFASPDPVPERAIADLLEAQDQVPADIEDLGAYVCGVIDAVVALYHGRGVVPVLVAGGWQFRTAPDLAPRLTRVLHRPRRLARAAMETLAIVAYHQPCTRADIEEIRGVSLSQQVLDNLLEAALIVPRGRKEVPGRPILWGTSGDFLRHFGLRDLRDLPRREELLVDVPDNPALDRPGADNPSGALFQAVPDASPT
jgi:segregation and condensation protein B